MQPLSALRRRLYFFTFFALFLLCLPVAILFASGYRFSSQFGFVRTGGIFLSVPYNGATVYLNGEAVGESGLLKRGFYIDSLPPNAYEVRVEHEDSVPWYRTLVVEPEMVTDAETLLVSDEIVPVPLSYQKPLATSSREITRAQYDAFVAVFKLPAATSTAVVEGEQVVVEDGNVFVRITDSDTIPSSNFCGRPSFCVRSVPVEEGRHIATNAFYLASNIVYVTKEGGVFLGEVDIRPTALSIPLYPQRGADARLIDGRLIVKDGVNFYEIEGL